MHRLVPPVLFCLVLGPVSPASAREPDLESGAEVYAKRCAQCHGADGAGDGPAAKFMRPRPRIFKENAAYKFRSTPSGELPTRADLYRVIAQGIPGTSMPGFPEITEDERWDLVVFIESLAEEFADEEALETAVIAEELQDPDIPPVTPEILERGRAVYVESQCAQCHGENGRGNGPSWPDLKDDWGDPIVAANLHNKESYRNGYTAYDVFRTITTGLNGTPMPAYRDTVGVEDRWALTHFVLSMSPPVAATRDEVVAAVRVEALPGEPDAEAWSAAPQARFQMVPNIVTAPRLFWTTVEYVNVQALYSRGEVALRITWDDRSESKGKVERRYPDRDTDIYQTTDHPDQIAVQMPVKVDPSKRPYFIFGDTKRPVNLWWWRGDQGALLERNAKGWGTFTDQPDESQGLRGAVTYADGQYTMIVRRALQTSNTKRDIQFTPGEFVPIAFHVWDGASGESGNRHALTTWYWLYLAPEPPQRLALVGPLAFVATFIVLFLALRWIRRREESSAREARAVNADLTGAATGA